MVTKICLIGYGRMGKTIADLANGANAVVHYIKQRNEAWDFEQLKACDVAIEFSIPNSAFDNISTCIQHGIPIVSGTTGWLDRLDEIKEKLDESQQSAFLYGSNFSLGMNLFFRINSYTASLLQVDSSLKLDMSEIHHTKKLDQPSGTAITLAEDIIGIRADKSNWINAQSDSDDTIGITSVREPDVPGTHIVQYENETDKISISHQAKSRIGFASGAILAAKWLIGREGYFTISDYIDDLITGKK